MSFLPQLDRAGVRPTTAPEELPPPKESAPNPWGASAVAIGGMDEGRIRNPEPRVAKAPPSSFSEENPSLAEGLASSRRSALQPLLTEGAAASDPCREPLATKPRLCRRLGTPSTRGASDCLRLRDALEESSPQASAAS